MDGVTTEKHSPFNNAATLLVFGLKTHTHTHALTNAKCIHYQILQPAFRELLGKVNAANLPGCPNTSTLFPMDSFHILF